MPDELPPPNESGYVRGYVRPVPATLSPSVKFDAESEYWRGSAALYSSVTGIRFPTMRVVSDAALRGRPLKRRVICPGNWNERGSVASVSCANESGLHTSMSASCFVTP